MSRLLDTTERGNIAYLALSPEDISPPPTLLDSFVRHQVVQMVVRTIDGERRIVADPFIDDWTLPERRRLTEKLRQLSASGGLVAAAYHAGKLLGFAAVSGERIGSRRQYADLFELHVDENARRRGIGAHLFGLACLFARSLGAESLYLSAHSAIETQRFYAALGCVEAREPQAGHVACEPFDVQMEALLLP